MLNNCAASSIGDCIVDTNSIIKIQFIGLVLDSGKFFKSSAHKKIKF